MFHLLMVGACAVIAFCCKLFPRMLYSAVHFITVPIYLTYCKPGPWPCCNGACLYLVAWCLVVVVAVNSCAGSTSTYLTISIAQPPCCWIMTASSRYWCTCTVLYCLSTDDAVDCSRSLHRVCT